MGRVDQTSDEYRAVRAQAAELVRRAGSVNGASALLTERLGQHGTVYPNRLHSLLSEERTKTVNQATFSQIRAGLHALSCEGYFASPLPPDADKLTRIVLDRWNASTGAESEVVRIGEQLEQPPAVIRHILEQAGIAPGAVRETLSAGDKARRPDYSFQDAAVEACLSSYRQRPRAKIAAVVPTGGGKTDIALRIALAILKEFDVPTARVIWVTHRLSLKGQARDRLQELVSRQVRGLAPEDIRIFGAQIEFVMLHDLRSTIERLGSAVKLIVVDEAHHAAAASYDVVFEGGQPAASEEDPASYGFPVLALTATPNRTDGREIRIDEIAYTITFRELAERGVILRPQIERFPVPDFDWSDASVRRLAEHILTHGGTKYRKVLIIAPQVAKVRKIHDILQDEAQHRDSFFAAEDIFYIAADGNSEHIANEDFLTEFRKKKSAVIVSAQLLLEGYDDPLIDTVVITYPTQSVVMLMQAAGRCVRYHPDKKEAYVIQADDRIHYFFDHRWLYQDISDFPRPQLLDIKYGDAAEREESVRRLLLSHRVPEQRIASVLNEVRALPLAEEFQLILAGAPYYGPPEEFEEKAQWLASVLTKATRRVFVDLFNELCALGRRSGEVVPDVLIRTVAERHAIPSSSSEDSVWVQLFNLGLSVQKAVMEVHEIDREHYSGGGRMRPPNRATSWLKYVTFGLDAKLAPEISEFIADAVNREEIRERLIKSPGADAVLVRQPLPIAGSEVFAFDASGFEKLRRLVLELTNALSAVAPTNRVSATRAWFSSLPEFPLPLRLAELLPLLTRQDFWKANVLTLNNHEEKSQAPAVPHDSSAIQLAAS